MKIKKLRLAFVAILEDNTLTLYSNKEILRYTQYRFEVQQKITSDNKFHFLLNNLRILKCITHTHTHIHIHIEFLVIINL